MLYTGDKGHTRRHTLSDNRRTPADAQSMWLCHIRRHTRFNWEKPIQVRNYCRASRLSACGDVTDDLFVHHLIVALQ
jgi:hypothetical protein